MKYIGVDCDSLWIFRNPKLYWIRRRGWKVHYGVDHRCNCKNTVSFAPCTECGAGC